MSRRTAPATACLRRRALGAAAGLAAVGVLTACGATAHPGAAAVVGDTRITTASLQSHVTAFRTALAQRSAGATEGYGLVRHTLQILVESQLVDQALAAKGLTVTRAEVQQAHAQAVAQTGSEAALEQAFLSQLGLAPSDMDTYFRMAVGEQKLLTANGVNPSSSQADSALQSILAAASKRFGVSVNPRYGNWDANTAALGAASQPWVKNTGAA